MWPFEEKTTSINEALFGKDKKECNTTKLMVKVNDFIKKREERNEKKMSRRLKKAKKKCDKSLKRAKKDYEHELKRLHRRVKRDKELIDLDDSSYESPSSSTISSSSEVSDSSPKSLSELSDSPKSRRHRRKSSRDRRKSSRDEYDKTRRSGLGRSGANKVIKVVFSVGPSLRASSRGNRGITLEGERLLKARAEKAMSELKRYVTSVTNVQASAQSATVTVKAKVTGSKADIEHALSRFPLSTAVGNYKFTNYRLTYL